MARGSVVKERIRLSGWPRGLLESANFDSSSVNRETLARALNVVIDETGGLSQRLGMALRAQGVPSRNSRLFLYRKGSTFALLESDGVNINRLTDSGFVPIGSFSSGGTRADAVVVNGRAYLVNGSGKMMVVEEKSGTWDVREAGVPRPQNAPGISYSGGSGAPIALGFGITWVDDRGFESNVSPQATSASILPGAAVTVTRNNTPPTGSNSAWGWHVYGTLRNLPGLYRLTTSPLPISSTAYTTDTNNISRDEAYPAPTDHDVPPEGITSLSYYRSRLYGAQMAGRDTYYAFSELMSLDNPGVEYWPPKNTDDLGVIEPSPVLALIPVAGGLLIAKRHSILLLDRDPVFGSAPRPIIPQYGLINSDAWTVTHGKALLACDPGLVLLDGLRADEVFRFLQETSASIAQASSVSGTFTPNEGSIYYSIPSVTNRVRRISYRPSHNRFEEAEYTVDVGASTVTDATLDFNQEEDVAQHANLVASPFTVNAGDIVSNWKNIPNLSGGTYYSTPPDTAIDYIYSSGTQTKITTFASGFINRTESVSFDGTPPPPGSQLLEVRGTKVSGGKLTRTFHEGPVTNTDLNDYILSFSPRAYYKMEDSTTTMTDSSGNGINGTHHNAILQVPTFLTNSSSYAVKYGLNDNSMGRVYPSPPLLSGFSQGLTVVVFARQRPISFPLYADMKVWLVRKADYTLKVRAPTNDALDLVFDFTTSTGTQYVATGNLFPSGPLLHWTWPHLYWGVWYREGDSSYIVCGIDDIVIGQATQSIPSSQSLQNTSGPLDIGIPNDARGSPIEVDEVAIFDRGLKYNEILNLYKKGFWAVGYREYGQDDDKPFSAVTASKSFIDFLSFGTPPITVSGVEVSGQTKVRIAMRFEDSSPPFLLSSWKVFQSGAWVPLSSEPTYGNDAGTMSISQVNSLTDDDLRATGGIDPDNPKIQFRIWLMGNKANEASVDQITIRYNSGTSSLSTTVHVTEDVDLGSSNVLQRGTYIWNTAGGYKIDEGNTDNGEKIVCDVRTQQIAVGSGESDMVTIEPDIENKAHVADIEATPITDGVPHPQADPIQFQAEFGRKTYQIGAPPDTIGLRHAVRMKWEDHRVKVHGLSVVVEPRGRSEPL